jgi:putative DNA primase/helicase
MSAAYNYRDLTEDEIAEALSYIDADCDRNTWFQMAAAVKSELGGAGWAIWDAWSKGGQKYNHKDARDTWKSAKPTGGTTIATLIGEAQQFGFSLNHALRQPLSDEQVKARKTKREAEEAAAEAEKNRKYAEAAERANDIWLAARDAEGDEHPYLQRKGIGAYGLKIGKWRNGAEALLVPLRNSDGQLTSLQAIFANSDTQLGRDRDYLPGGRKWGSYHVIGTIAGSAPLIILSEGYSTGGSCHMAKGCPVAVCFDAGNIPTVARALRAKYPLATLVVAADNDQYHVNHSNDGINYARQAATSAAAIIAVPRFADLAGEPTDFNDLHLREGLQAVRDQLDTVLPGAANDNYLPLDSNVNPFMFPHMSVKQKPLNTWENLRWMLQQYGITANYNIISKDITVTVPTRDYGEESAANCALAEINSLCSRNQLAKSDTADYIKLIAAEHRFNPVSDFILSKPWDGISRLPALYETLHTPPSYPRTLLALLVRRWLISAVAAAMSPTGFWTKGTLVLQGDQSLGKTSWIKALVPMQLRGLFKEGASIDPANKDTIISAISHWIVELGELDGTFRRADIAKLKAFISAGTDLVRKPYDRLESKYPRRTVFFASVNPQHFLADETGNVRWWTVAVTGVNYEHDIDVQQLWAEVATLYRDGERWWLTRDEEQQLEQVNREHESVDPLEEMIKQRYPWGQVNAVAYREMSASEVLLDIGYDKPNKKQATDVSAILRKLTGKKAKHTNRGRVFQVPRNGGPL